VTRQKPDDLADFLIGLFAVSSIVFAVVCVIALAVSS
jgi:hypothetical protein